MAIRKIREHLNRRRYHKMRDNLTDSSIALQFDPFWFEIRPFYIRTKPVAPMSQRWHVRLRVNSARRWRRHALARSLDRAHYAWTRYRWSKGLLLITLIGFQTSPCP